MARDAIARLYDVDANSVRLEKLESKGQYQHGIIRFRAKADKSIALDLLHESITATRLSGGTNMRVDYLEITARGQVSVRDKKELLFKVAATGQTFVLAEDAETKALSRLRAQLEKGANITSVTGRVPGWAGRFPDVLKALAGNAAKQTLTLLVTNFEASSK
ncbi:MAG: hypothetical protein L0215_26430 [Gemmataceae bacterium]|nr:hypothetical protein [Gemmataceae bacterium]